MSEKAVVEYRLVVPSNQPDTCIIIEWLEGQNPQEDGARLELPMGPIEAVQRSLAEGWTEDTWAFDAEMAPTQYRLRRQRQR